MQFFALFTSGQRDSSHGMLWHLLLCIVESQDDSEHSGRDREEDWIQRCGHDPRLRATVTVFATLLSFANVPRW